MRRDSVVFRTSITVTAAVLAALATLAACGPVQMGSAAIAGDQPIPAATLTNEVAHLQTAYQASKGSIQLQFPVSQAPQQVLGWLMRFRIREQMLVRFNIGERMAGRKGITVTRADSQRALASIAAQARQSKVTLPQLAVANGLPPDLLPDLGRYQAIEVDIVRKLDGGTLPASQSGLATLSREFDRQQCLAAKSLAIRVNPQFGRMDYSQLAVIPAPLTLSAPQGGVPTPSPAPQLTPAC
jgi:hypothetical protein